MSESNALDIKFKELASGDIASPKLQGWIIEAIEKGKVEGLSGYPLCDQVSTYMTNDHGKYWHCFVGHKYSSFYDVKPGTDNAAMFFLGKWLFFLSNWLVELI